MPLIQFQIMSLDQDSDPKSSEGCQGEKEEEDKNAIKVNEEVSEQQSSSNEKSVVVHVTSNRMFEIDADVQGSNNTISGRSDPHQSNDHANGNDGRGSHRVDDWRESFAAEEGITGGRRRQHPEEVRTKATCSDQAMVLSLTINVLSLILTIAVIILVVALMMSMAATNHLHSRTSSDSSFSFHAPFDRDSEAYSSPTSSSGTEQLSSPSERSSGWSHKYRISSTQTITSKFPYSPFPPLSSPITLSISSQSSSPSVIFSSPSSSSSSSSSQSEPREQNSKEDIVEVPEGRRKANEEADEINKGDGNEGNENIDETKNRKQGNGYDIIIAKEEEEEAKRDETSNKGWESNDEKEDRYDTNNDLVADEMGGREDLCLGVFPSSDFKMDSTIRLSGPYLVKENVKRP